MTKLKGLRWWIVGLVALATTVNYIDRSALAIMWPRIAEDLGLSKDDYANIAIFFTMAYAVSQSLSGRLFDRIGTRLGFVVSITVWSIAAALHGFARGVPSFIAFRVLLGLGEAGNWPGAVKSNGEWFPVSERAFAQGIFNSGASIGSIISPILIALLYLQLGWQVTFILLGAAGFLWVVPWLVVNRAGPETHPWLSEAERSHILGDQPPVDVTGHNPSLVQLLCTKETWSVLASRFFLDPIWWLFVFWLPIYLSERFGFDIKEIGMFAWMPYVGAAVGSLFGGFIAGVFIKRGWSVAAARRLAVSLGGGFMLPSLVSTAFANDPAVAIGLITLILFGFQTAISNVQTLPSDLFTGNSVGTVAGMGGTTAALGVILTTWLVPAITATNYDAFFFLGAALVPLGVACVFIFGRSAQDLSPDGSEFAGSISKG